MSTASKGKTFGSKLSTPSQSINLNQQYHTSAMNTPNGDSQHQYKSSFKSGSVFVGNADAVNPVQGAYMKTNKGSVAGDYNHHHAKQ